MLYNYLKIAIRNLLQYKSFSFINIFGLALGMTCSILLMLWVQDERSFDQFHKNGPYLYRILANLHWGEIKTSTNTPGPLSTVLKKAIPEIDQIVKIDYNAGGLFKVGHKINQENAGWHVSANFFEMFSFPLKQGHPKKVLQAPDAIVISENLAQKYFGRQNPVGKIIRIKEAGNFRVTGVMYNMPQNSSMQVDFVLPLEFYERSRNDHFIWRNFNLKTYITLRPDASREQVEAKLKNLLKKYSPEPDSQKDELFLQPFREMYLYSEFTNGKQAGGRIEYVNLFSVVAVFILIIASINFMNLSTARSAHRAKEVGVRKVIGATPGHLIGQFLGESILVAFIAMFFAVLLIDQCMPFFNQFTGKNITVHFWQSSFLSLLLITAVLTGILSGSYPALFLSSLKPVVVLKGTLKFKPRAILLRQGLVIFQFMLSIILIIGMLVIYRQIAFIKSKNLGINRDNVVMLNLDKDLLDHFKAFKHDLTQISGVSSVTASSGNPLDVGSASSDIEWPGKPKDGASVAALNVGYDFIQTMNIRLKEGRDFSEALTTDTANYIINEAAARMMQMDKPLHQEITFWKGKGRIIGVMKDYHLQSLHRPIGPLILVLNPQYVSPALIKVNSHNLPVTLAAIQAVAKKYSPDYASAYRFLDEAFQDRYQSETMVGKLTKYFAGIAIIISCLGLFGLALFTAEQRTKEISIRKVLGASSGGIITMLSKDFLKLVLAANFISWPLGWYLMRQWLQNFAYRVDIEPWVFAFAAVTTLLIALCTVGAQAIRAAIANPVKSLRSE